MRRIDEVLTEIDNLIDQAALEDFIARGWVRPLRDQTDYAFEDVDISRIQLVCELRIDMRLELDAIDIILSLMDQLYESRARFDRLIEALGNQPENVRNSIIKSLRDA
jgi:chaperone modulatory protein CbpM